MATETTPTTTSSASSAGGATEPQRVYVEIPRAKPGQEYRAPKNYQQPFLQAIGAIFVILLCLSLPFAPLAIIFLILFTSHAVADGLLPLWIIMTILVESIAIFVAVNVAREALGWMGVRVYRGGRTISY